MTCDSCTTRARRKAILTYRDRGGSAVVFMKDREWIDKRKHKITAREEEEGERVRYNDGEKILIDVYMFPSLNTEALDRQS